MLAVISLSFFICFCECLCLGDYTIKWEQEKFVFGFLHCNWCIMEQKNLFMLSENLLWRCLYCITNTQTETTTPLVSADGLPYYSLSCGAQWWNLAPLCIIKFQPELNNNNNDNNLHRSQLNIFQFPPLHILLLCNQCLLYNGPLSKCGASLGIFNPRLRKHWAGRRIFYVVGANHGPPKWIFSSLRAPLRLRVIA